MELISDIVHSCPVPFFEKSLGVGRVYSVCSGTVMYNEPMNIGLEDDTDEEDNQIFLVSVISFFCISFPS